MAMIELNATSDPDGGREVITKAVAKRIVRLIEAMPDENVAISWRNIIIQIKKNLNIDVKRNVLSQKKWGDRRLIFEAYLEAMAVDRRKRHQARPKYAHSSKKVLLERIGGLDKDLNEFQEQLTQIRLAQISPVDLFRIRREDLKDSMETVPAGENQPLERIKGAGGRSEVLTKKLADQICIVVRQMPQNRIDVTWDNVIAQISRQLGLSFRRNVLSQKAWNGRKLLAEAYREAKLEQLNLSTHSSLGKPESERHAVHARREALEARADAIERELADERLKQLAAFESFRQERLDLRNLVSI